MESESDMTEDVRATTQVSPSGAFFLLGGFLVIKNPPANAGEVRDVGSIPRSGRSPGEGHGNPL